MTAKELKKVKVERCVESFFSSGECHSTVLNAARYLEKNGALGMNSESAIEMLSGIALAFAAGELDWVKDLERDEE